MEGWKTVRLGDVCHIIGGGTPSKRNPAFYEGDIPWATVRDMKNQFLEKTEFSITQDAVKKSSTNIIPAGNVVIATRVGLGKVCLLAQDMAINQDLRGVVPKEIWALSSKYLFYWFTHISPCILSAGTGATVQGVKLDFVKSLSLPLPPLPEQQCIVAILEDAFTALAKAKENTERSCVLAREVFESERDEILFSYKDKGMCLPLEEACFAFEYGTSAKSQATGVTPVLRMGNVRDGEIDWSDLVYSSSFEEMKKYRLKRNDVLFNRTNSAEHVGKTAIYRGEREALFAGYLIRLCYDPEKVDPEYLNFYLNSSMARTHGKAVMAQSVNQANISASKLSKYPFICPPLPDQQRIAAKLDDLSSQTKALEEKYQHKLAALEELKQSLLHRAFTGELTRNFREIERQLSEVGA